MSRTPTKYRGLPSNLMTLMASLWHCYGIPMGAHGTSPRNFVQAPERRRIFMGTKCHDSHKLSWAPTKKKYYDGIGTAIWLFHRSPWHVMGIAETCDESLVESGHLTGLTTYRRSGYFLRVGLNPTPPARFQTS